ncbi:MAG: hypothetical protein QM692_09450 [Thermomicrobiales bacterium]
MIILLDSGPLGLLVHPKVASPPVIACKSWLSAIAASGHHIALPGIIEYELKRELVRMQSQYSMTRLVLLANSAAYLPVTRDVLNRAAEFWALARQTNHPATADKRIDIDMIVAAHADMITRANPDVEVVIATTNTRHFAGLAPAQNWNAIT